MTAPHPLGPRGKPLSPWLALAWLLLVLAPHPAAAAAPAWAAPLAGALRVVRPFDAPANPYAAGHRGVDLAAAPGSAVLAAGDGSVAFAGVVAGRGVVSVQSGALRTTYEPVQPVVRTGSAVRRGDVLGRLDRGHPGCPTTACLHWGLRRGVRYLDPLLLLRRPVIRLLPLEGQPATRSRASVPPSPRPAPRNRAPGPVGPDLPTRTAVGAGLAAAALLRALSRRAGG